MKIENLLDPKVIFYDKNINSKEFWQKRAELIISKYPKATVKEVNSHWNIPELNQDPSKAESWAKNKKDYLVLGIKKGDQFRENGRSTDFIAMSQSSGCALVCSYCYINRRKGYANPITTFLNIDDIVNSIKNHQSALGPKTSPNQCDPDYWTYEIGENSDVSVDAYVSTNISTLISKAKTFEHAKLSFATKHVNYNMLSYDPQRKTRIRFSLMPEKVSKVVDVKTTNITERIQAINQFYEAGYEVHLNFSPVILYPDWKNDYRNLFKEIDATLSQKVKDQLKCEIIFLTHNEEMHELNLLWHPKSEDYLWKPSIQEQKQSLNGMTNIRYQYQLKSKYIKSFQDLMAQEIPYCQIRYCF